MSLALRGFEFNLFGSLNRRFVQAVPQAAHHAHHAEFAACFEHDFEKNFAFDFQAARFGSIGRRRLGNDLRRNEFRLLFNTTLVGLLRGFGIAESGFAHATARCFPSSLYEVMRS